MSDSKFIVLDTSGDIPNNTRGNEECYLIDDFEGETWFPWLENLTDANDRATYLNEDLDTPGVWRPFIAIPIPGELQPIIERNEFPHHVQLFYRLSYEALAETYDTAFLSGDEKAMLTEWLERELEIEADERDE